MIEVLFVLKNIARKAIFKFCNLLHLKCVLHDFFKCGVTSNFPKMNARSRAVKKIAYLNA